MKLVLVISTLVRGSHLAKRLQQDGYQVRCHTGSTAEGFRMIETLRPALVVVEYQRGDDYDGQQLIYVLRNTPGLDRTLVLLLAHKNPWFDIQAYLQTFKFQADACLLMPFGLEEFAGTVASLLARDELPDR